MKSFAFLPALVASAAAIPALQKKDVEKKDVVWVTEYDVKVTTVDVYTTIFVTAGAEPTPDGQQFQNKHVIANHDDDNGFAVTFSIPTAATTPAPVAKPKVAAQQAGPAAAPPVQNNPAPAPAPVATTSPPAPALPVTSQYVAPAPAPQATTAPAAAPKASTPSTAAPASGGSCDSTSPGAGCSDAYFSYYDVGMGACGITSVDTDYVFAISATVFDAHMVDGNPNHDALCGRKITITSHSGSPITATLVDRCVGCADMTHLDLSPSLWNAVSAGDPKADGLCKGYTWEWQ